MLKILATVKTHRAVSLRLFNCLSIPYVLTTLLTVYAPPVYDFFFFLFRYAWVVLLVVFTINTIVAGYVKSFALLFVYILDYFPDASGAATGLVIGMLVGCRGLLGKYCFCMG